MLLVEMMADLDEEVAELFLMEEEVLLISREMVFSHCWLIQRWQYKLRAWLHVLS